MANFRTTLHTVLDSGPPFIVRWRDAVLGDQTRSPLSRIMWWNRHCNKPVVFTITSTLLAFHGFRMHCLIWIRRSLIKFHPSPGLVPNSTDLTRAQFWTQGSGSRSLQDLLQASPLTCVAFQEPNFHAPTADIARMLMLNTVAEACRYSAGQ